MDLCWIHCNYFLFGHQSWFYSPYSLKWDDRQQQHSYDLSAQSWKTKLNAFRYMNDQVCFDVLEMNAHCSSASSSSEVLALTEHAAVHTSISEKSSFSMGDNFLTLNWSVFFLLFEDCKVPQISGTILGPKSNTKNIMTKKSSFSRINYQHHSFSLSSLNTSIIQ